MLIVATVETQTPDLADGSKSESVGIAIVFLLFLFIFFYKPSWGAVTWIWSSEIFSMNVRALGVGIAGQTQNIANAIVQQFFPTFLNNCGFYAFYSESPRRGPAELLVISSCHAHKPLTRGRFPSVCRH